MLDAARFPFAFCAIVVGGLVLAAPPAVFDRIEAHVEDAILGARVHLRGDVVAGSLVTRGDRTSFVVAVGSALYRVEAPPWIVPDTVGMAACRSASTWVDVAGRRRGDRTVEASGILGRAGSCR